MVPPTEVEKVRAFIRANIGKTLFSTGAKIVYFKGSLYNITGSTHDPQQVRDYEGENWKSLLVRKAELDDARCYVTNLSAPKGSNHDNFAVGGHMTTNPDGEVEKGGISYLMPLCKWHNSTARNGEAFEHTETKMLRLTGFMEGETPTTFMARMPSEKSHVLLYLDPLSGRWESSHLDAEQAIAPEAKLFSDAIKITQPSEYAVLENRGDGFFIKAAKLA